MSSLSPRVVVVTRQSEYQALLAAHGTRGQAAFFLERRGQRIDQVEAVHEQLAAAVAQTKAEIPPDWSIAAVERSDLDRFLFTPNDIVVAVGQDGLVANLAKYCPGRPVLGVTPGAAGSEGVLTRIPPTAVGRLLDAVARNAATIERRTMVAADAGGDTLLALNELFIGHRSHQSARYLLHLDGAEEFQSSSGIIVSTGTGATGWAKSVMAATGQTFDIGPTDPAAVYFAREPWPSARSGCEMRAGAIPRGRALRVTSRINEGGVIFADGIEQDFLRFDWGTRAEIAVSQRTLDLVAA